MNINTILLLLSAVFLNIVSLTPFLSAYTLPIYSVIIGVVTTIFVYKNYKELTLSRITLFLLSCLAFALYGFFRISASSMSNASVLRFGNNIMTSCMLYFSFVYGISQILIGYFFTKMPVISSIISYMGVCITLICISMCKSAFITKILFGVLGLLSVGVNMNTNVCPNKYFSPSWFSTLSIYGVAFGFYGASGVLISITKLFTWSGLYKVIGIIAGILACIYGLVAFYLNGGICGKSGQKSQCSITDEQSHETNTTFSDVNNTESSANISIKQILYMFIYCALVVLPYYAIQVGMTIVNRDVMITGELSGLICLLIPVIENLGDKNIMYGSCIIGIISLLIVIFFKNTILLQLAIAGITCIAMSHNFPFVIVGKKMKNPGTIFGILNFGAMFLGCFGGQYLYNNFLVAYGIKTIMTIFLCCFTAAFGCVYLI